jgi:hypothetical protein
MNSNSKKLETQNIFPADSYNSIDDLWILTCYFNPNNYKTRLENYEIFREKFQKSNLKLLTVECAFGDTSFQLEPHSDLLQIRSPHVMWQKERLLNILVSRLPAVVQKIAWVDCDILFENPNWAIQTSRLLEIFPVVQPFARVVRLPKGEVNYEGEGTFWNSFGYMRMIKPELLTRGYFYLHGHTGMAWAGRREIFQKCGFYDVSLSGNADHLMAHSMCGDFSSPCVEKYLGKNGRLQKHFAEWSDSFYQEIAGKVGYSPGTILHLWHGERKDRQYVEKSEELRSFDFDPLADISVSSTGCWEWSSDKPSLHNWAVNYFRSRKEDG